MVILRYLPLKVFDFYTQKADIETSIEPSVYADLNTDCFELLTKKSLITIGVVIRRIGLHL